MTNEELEAKILQVETDLDARLDSLELWRMEKPGWKTTEFWGSAALAICTMAMQLDLFGPTTTQYKIVALVAGTLSILGYSVSRGLAKNKQINIAA